MGQRDDRGNTKLELEAHTNVNQYHRQSNQKPKTAVFLELLAHLGTDKLGADQFELRAGCRQSSRYLAGQLVITQIGRASCRERVEITVVAVALKKKRIDKRDRERV